MKNKTIILIKKQQTIKNNCTTKNKKWMTENQTFLSNKKQFNSGLNRPPAWAKQKSNLWPI